MIHVGNLVEPGLEEITLPAVSSLPGKVGRRVAAAISPVGAPDRRADLALDVGNDGGQRVPVVRVAGIAFACATNWPPAECVVVLDAANRLRRALTAETMRYHAGG